MTSEHSIIAHMIHDDLVACGQSSDPDDEPPPPIIDDYDTDPIDEGDPIEEPRDDEFARNDPDDGGPDPWPDGPCRNSAGAHHVQRCPEVLAALRAPYPNGAEIARAFHRNYRGWAREEMRKDFDEVLRDAKLYADYISARLPKQEPMTFLRVIRIWDRAAQVPA